MGPTVIAVCTLLALPRMAQAAPSEEEIAATQAAEEVAKMSAAQIEVKLTEVGARAATVTQNVQIVGEDLNEANIALSEAIETATRASPEADAVEAALQEGKQQIASVTQTAYRGGGGTLDSLAPYLDSDGLCTVEMKQAGANSFSPSAEVKMQNVAVLEQVAKVTRNAANFALASQQATTDMVKTRTDAANEAAAVTQNEVVIVTTQRGIYMQKFATKQSMTVDLTNQRETALGVERQEAVRITAKQAAAAADAQCQVDVAAAAAAAAAAVPSQASSSSDDEDDDDDYSYSVSSYSASFYSYEEPSYSAPFYSDGGADMTIATVKSYLGVSYVRGGESYGGVDCSGLTMFTWENVGVDLSHLSRAQYGYSTHVLIGSVEAGDLIFWPSSGTQSGICHVAIYLDGGQMIEALTFGVPVCIIGVHSQGSIMLYAVRL